MGFDHILKFEQALAEFTGAPYAVMTDCCTHAIELCLRYDQVKECKFTPYTYLSVPMTMHKLGIKYKYLDHEWQRWVGEYPFLDTRIWDSARRLESGMYRAGTMQCLSFGNTKPLEMGRGGAILLDDATAYHILLQQRSDGRDLSISPWPKQRNFLVGYHYRPTIEESIRGLELLVAYQKLPPESQKSQWVEYHDCRDIQIT